MKLFPLFLFLLSFSLSARDRATHESLNDLLEIIRDPVFTSKQRTEYLDFSRRMMSGMLARELGVQEDQLTLSFVKNATRSTYLLQPHWHDVQTQFYTTLHQENFFERWQKLQRLVKFTAYGKSITATMMAHLGQFDPVSEGRFYVRWSQVRLKTGGKTRQFNVPYFLMSKKIQDLVEFEDHVPFQEMMTEKELISFNSFTTKLTRLEKQELAEKRELNRRIFLRAVANGAKTVGSIHHLTGIMNRHNTEQKVISFVQDNCNGCSLKEKNDIQKSALNYLDAMKKVVTHSGPGDIINGFCETLRSNNYSWNAESYKLKGKNREAMAKTILQQDMGVLFLTGAITLMDKNAEPVGTKLQCSKNSLKGDTRLLVSSVNDAQKNIETYIKKISDKIRTASYSLQNTTNVLEYFVQTNQAATIEATSFYPQGIGWVLRSIAELDADKKRREKTDSVITWGGTIIGIGLTLTGIGAPEGVAILLSTAGMIKGIGAGSYYLVRSRQEKNFAREMKLVKHAGPSLSEENLREHYRKYKSLKVSYIKEFSSSAFSFVSIHRAALRHTGGDINKAHTIMEKVLKTVKESGRDEVIGKIQEMVIELAVNS